MQPLQQGSRIRETIVNGYYTVEIQRLRQNGWQQELTIQVREPENVQAQVTDNDDDESSSLSYSDPDSPRYIRHRLREAPDPAVIPRPLPFWERVKRWAVSQAPAFLSRG